MKKLILISALLLFASNGWAEEIAIKCETDLDDKPYSYQILHLSEGYIERFMIYKNKWVTFPLTIGLTDVYWTQTQEGSEGKNFMLTSYSIDREKLLIKWQSTIVERLTLDKQSRNCELLSVKEIKTLAKQEIKERTKKNKF